MFKKKKAARSRKRERSLDSCQLIKNNECSRGFNFLPSQQPAQHNRLPEEEESRQKTHSLSASQDDISQQLHTSI